MPVTTTPTTDATDAKPAPIKVRVPQDDGTIVITTFDTKAPHRFTVTGGVVEAASQAEADLVLARVDGASLSS